MSTTVTKGPCQVEFSTYKFQTKGDVIVTMNPETFGVMTDAHGTVDERLKSRSFTVAFEPAGEWEGDAMALILAAAARQPGTSIMGGALTIKPYISAQSVITFDRAGVTGLPGLKLGASKTLYGGLTFTCLETAGSETGAIAAASTYAAPTNTFDPVNILTEPWTGVWSAAIGDAADDDNLTGLETEDGWEITTDLSTEASRADSVGITDYIQTDFKASATCMPVGLTETQLLRLVQRSGAGRALQPGSSLHGRDGDGLIDRRTLFLTSRSGYNLTLVHAGLKSGVLRYGAKTNRTGALTFTGLRKFTSGAIQSLLTFAEPV